MFHSGPDGLTVARLVASLADDHRPGLRVPAASPWPPDLPAASLPATNPPVMNLPVTDLPATDLPAANPPATDLPATNLRLAEGGVSRRRGQAAWEASTRRANELGRVEEASEVKEASFDGIVMAAARRGTLASELAGTGPPHVAVLLPNTAEHLLWLEGCALAGSVVVGANPTHPASDLARELAHTAAGLLVTDQAGLSMLEGFDLGQRLGRVSASNPKVLVVDGPEYPAVLEHVGSPSLDALPWRDLEPSTLGHLVFTSGTSGAPKACKCSQGRLATIGSILASMLPLGPDDVCYIAMPLFHSNALMAGYAPALAAKAAIALPSAGRFSASRLLADVRQLGATYFNYVGKPLAYVLATPERPDDADNPLRVAFGNEASATDVERFARRFGCSVIDGYGSTEGGVSISRTPDTPAGALGPAPPGVIVVDPTTGKECPRARFDGDGKLLNADEAIGEIVSTNAASSFEGYWQNEEAERAKLRGGWYWTGDLAYRDEAGYLWFAGRSDDWLRVEGENFAAAPVARILERHPDVVLAAVYGLPEESGGDRVVAALQLRPGASFDPVGFARFLAAQPDLGRKWVPMAVRVVERMPLTATNKVLVRELRRQGLDVDDPVYVRPDRRAPLDEPYVALRRERIDDMGGDQPTT